MSNKGSKAKVAGAYRAMKAIGISEDKVKPILKDLLKLYDKNWTYIEEDSYRVLADAIFERDESEAVERLKRNADSGAAEHSKKIVNNEKEDHLDEQSEETEEPERPLKRLRLKYRDGQSSSLNAPEISVPKMPLITPKEEPDELPETCLPNLSDGISKGMQPVNPQTMITKEGCNLDPQSVIHRNPQNTQLVNEENEYLPPQTTPSREKSLVHESSSHAVSNKESTIEPSLLLTSERKNAAIHALIKPKDEPITDDLAVLAVPIAVIHADPSNVETPLSKSFHEPSVSLSANENEPRNNGELEMITGQCSNLEIASLPIEDVKISLSCELEFERPDFRMPDRETVLRLVEEKCLKSYKLLNPNFSVMNLMKDMCRGFLDLGSHSSSEPLAGINMTPDIDLLSTQKLNDEDDHPETNVENEKNIADEMNLSLVVFKQPSVDIAKGQENAVITVVNEVNDEGLPRFFYLSKNAVFQKAAVKFLMARIGQKNCCSSCSGDCLSLSKPCACAHESGCGFAYSPDGLVREGFLEESISMTRYPKKQGRFFCKGCPQERAKGGDSVERCKGHIMRKFIKECWWKCGCDLQCGNRVVQRGISFDLQVFMTPEGKGWGLRTLVDLPKGAFVCEFVGGILTNAELYDHVMRCPEGEKTSYAVLLDADWGSKGALKDEEALCLDAANYGNIGRFINHRCYDANLVEIPVEIETPDRNYYHLAFFTTRTVNAMEELTWDYGIDFHDQDQFIKVFHCQCGSKFCRNEKC